MWVFGIFGYFMKKYEIPGGPMVIALVLGPMLEYNLYRALALSLGNISTFFTRPISATLLAMAGLMIVAVSFKAVRSKRSMLEDEEE
jgi:TctA family transporter